MNIYYNNGKGVFDSKLDTHPQLENVEIKLGSIHVIGYFYDLEEQKITLDHLKTYFINKNWKPIQNLDSKFLFVIKDDNEINIISDKSGYFTFYWGIENNNLYADIFVDRLLDKFSSLNIKLSNILWFLSLVDTNYNEETLFKEIHKLPPGCVLTIKDNYHTITEPTQLLEQKAHSFNSITDIAQEYLRDLENIIKIYGQKAKGRMVFDLSSGLDSTLLSFLGNKTNKESSYFRTVFDFSKEKLPENTGIINEFVYKHDLKNHTYIDIYTNHNLENQEVFNADYYLYNIASYEQLQNSTSVKNMGDIYVPGLGGNQVFNYLNVESYYNNFVYNFYYKAVKYAQTSGVYHLLSPTSQALYLSQDSYTRYNPYLSYLESTAINSLESTFHHNFKTGILQLTPFTDYRLVSKYKGLDNNLFPNLEGSKIRTEVLKNLIGEVYLPAQFDPINKQNYNEGLLNYYNLNKHLLKNLLKTNFYQQFDIVNISEIESVIEGKSIKHINEIGLFTYHLFRLYNYYTKLDKKINVNIVYE
jgi:hypothetical protein